MIQKDRQKEREYCNLYKNQTQDQDEVKVFRNVFVKMKQAKELRNPDIRDLQVQVTEQLVATHYEQTLNKKKYLDYLKKEKKKTAKFY